MGEHPYSRYTREKTWAALYSQHQQACYALVPYSATNNSIAVIRCKSAEEVQTMMQTLLEHAQACAAYYGEKRSEDQIPAFLTKARQAVILGKSSEYYHYHLSDHPEFKLVICGLHDSYLNLPVWETRTNTRYDPSHTSLVIGSDAFTAVRCTQYGHAILVGAMINGDHTALAYLKKLPPRTQRRIRSEVQEMQDTRYRGRPLAFLTETERHTIGKKISRGLKRYHEGRSKLS